MSDSSSFESKPHDGYHGSLPWKHDKNDWRGWIEGLVSYGNYAGPGNRHSHLSPEEQAKTDPDSIPAIDGIDGLARDHDHAYADAGVGKGPGKKGMWGWDGIRATHDADRALVQGTDDEMAAHGGEYSSTAERYSRAMRGIFGGRYKTVEAVDWLKAKGGEAKDGLGDAWNGAKNFVGDKAGEAKSGIGNFIQEAKGWSSLGDAWNGAKKGAKGAAGWLKDTAGEAAGGIGNGLKNGMGWAKDTVKEGWKGAKDTFNYFKGLGPAGMAGAVFGGGEAVGAGLAHLGGKAVDGVKSGAKKLWSKITPWGD